MAAQRHLPGLPGRQEQEEVPVCQCAQPVGGDLRTRQMRRAVSRQGPVPGSVRGLEQSRPGHRAAAHGVGRRLPELQPRLRPEPDQGLVHPGELLGQRQGHRQRHRALPHAGGRLLGAADRSPVALRSQGALQEVLQLQGQALGAPVPGSAGGQRAVDRRRHLRRHCPAAPRHRSRVDDEQRALPGEGPAGAGGQTPRGRRQAASSGLGAGQRAQRPRRHSQVRAAGPQDGLHLRRRADPAARSQDRLE
ncbi:hypothetical protein D9M70_400330 [compost metagenome]